MAVPGVSILGGSGPTPGVVLAAIVMGLVIPIVIGLLLILVIALPIAIRRIHSKVAA